MASSLPPRKPAVTPAVPAAPGVVIHRACDECRSRKLACSKDASGCARCKKEGIQCVYSPQKQMGRPRKRRMVEPEVSEVALPEVVELTAPDELALDPSLLLLDAGDVNFDFADLFAPENALPVHPVEPVEDIQTVPPPSADVELNYGLLGLGEIDFVDANYDTLSKAANRDIQTISQHMLAQLPVPEHDIDPRLSNSPSQSSSDTSSPTQTPQSCANTNCNCLSAIYLSMASLADLPQAAVPAMRVARHACKVALEAVHCPVCSLPLLRNPLARPSVQAFQNTWLLGAIIPTTVNAYARILELVDEEAARARAGGQRLYFAFRDCGGLWGRLAEAGDPCGTKAAYDGRHLEPDAWRQTVRALLRLDVYGSDLDLTPAAGEEPAAAGPRLARARHRGLKDVIDDLAERSRVRHATIDEMLSLGEIDAANSALVLPMAPGSGHRRPHNCETIIEMARVALDKLVIA